MMIYRVVFKSGDEVLVEVGEDDMYPELVNTPNIGYEVLHVPAGYSFRAEDVLYIAPVE